MLYNVFYEVKIPLILVVGGTHKIVKGYTTMQLFTTCFFDSHLNKNPLISSFTGSDKKAYLTT